MKTYTTITSLVRLSPIHCNSPLFVIMVSNLPHKCHVLPDGHVITAAFVGMDKDRFCSMFINGLQVSCASGSDSWLAMSANVSVGCTRQTIDIFVCRRHVGNVVPTRRRHSVMWANFLAVGVVSVRPIADTHSYVYVGISIDEVVTTYTKR
jgi:hypothetical protein